MSFFKNLLGFFSVPKKKNKSIGEIRRILRENGIRTRDDKGRFIPDDPATEENEAWVPRKK